jgi:hypothetical protein
MFLTIMQWPMTLAPTNEAIKRENQQKKPKRKKNYRHDPGGHTRCKDRILIKKSKIL